MRKGDWTLKISRWNNEKLTYDVEVIQLKSDEYPDYDAKVGEQITGVGVYPALYLVHIWIRPLKAVQS